MNKVIPEVPIELDKPRNLLVNFNAMRAFEKETGLNFFTTMSEPSATAFITAIWACLIHEDKTLTLDKVGEYVTPANLDYVTEKFLEAWGMAMPEAKSKNSSNRPSGTG